MLFEPVTDRCVRWRTASGDGLEHVVVTATDEGVEAKSWLIAPAEDGASALTYRLTCDADWCVRTFSLAASTGQSVSLRADGMGRWWDGDGALVGDLAGCIDIDFALTPLTNILPIRRLLDDRTTTQCDLNVVYIPADSFTPRPFRQRYTASEPGRAYRYESLDSDFTAVLPVDDIGLVVDYPGLWQRVQAEEPIP